LEEVKAMLAEVLFEVLFVGAEAMVVSGGVVEAASVVKDQE